MDQSSPSPRSEAATPPAQGPKTAESEAARPKVHYVIGALLLVFVAIATWATWHWGLLHRLSSKDRLIADLRREGSNGPLLCIGIQFLQVVIFIIPGEITQFAAGYVFGVWRGFLYSLAGIMLGSAFNFYFARIVGRPVLERLIGQSTLDKVDHLMESARGKSATFLLFLIPGTPKDALCYGAGLSALGLWEFVVISGLGRSPALISSLILGSQLSKRNYAGMVITAAVTGLAVLGYYLYERRKTRAAGSGGKA